jgi:hypothetical protein
VQKKFKLNKRFAEKMAFLAQNCSKITFFKRKYHKVRPIEL